MTHSVPFDNSDVTEQDSLDQMIEIHASPAPNSFISDLYDSIVKIASKPHIHARSISDLSDICNVPHFMSSVCRMLELGDNGTSM